MSRSAGGVTWSTASCCTNESVEWTACQKRTLHTLWCSQPEHGRRYLLICLQFSDFTANRVLMRLFKSSKIAILSNSVDISFMSIYRMYSFKSVFKEFCWMLLMMIGIFTLRLLLICIYCVTVLVKTIFVVVVYFCSFLLYYAQLWWIKMTNVIKLRLQPMESQYYTLNHKKRDILFLTITLANLRRFL